MTNARTYEDMADVMARGAAEGDFESWRPLFAPGATWWDAVGDTTNSVDHSLRGAAAVRGVISEMAYVEGRVTPTSTGYVDQHYIHAVLADGTRMRIPAVIVVTVENGLISHLVSYVEAMAAAPIAAALGAP